MVDQSVLRDKLIGESHGRLTQIQPSIYNIFGSYEVTLQGDSVLYDLTDFYSNPAISKGDTYRYVYSQGAIQTKSRRIQRYTSGLKLSEVAAENLNGEALQHKIAEQGEAAVGIVDTDMYKDMIGYANSVDGVSVLNAKAVSTDISDPADCNSTPGTAADLHSSVILSGTGQTERNLEHAVGQAVRGISTKTLNTTTGRGAFNMQGKNSLELWMNPNTAQILNTSYDLLDSGEHDNVPYTSRLAQSWNASIVPSLGIDSYNGSSGAATILVTLNTKENFRIAKPKSDNPKWTAWERINNGEEISWVKNYRAGAGAFARSFKNGNYFYKPMYAISVTPVGT